jgi:hypothetical protein
MDQQHELRSFLEILDVCKADLHKLLTCDHPPHNSAKLIAKERQNISDIEYLVADIKAQIASKKIYKQMMTEYSMVHSMNRFKI